MQIHRVRGNDLKDALQRARRSFGESALVISHEVLGDGGVTLAVAQRPAGASPETGAAGSSTNASMIPRAQRLSSLSWPRSTLWTIGTAPLFTTRP